MRLEFLSVGGWLLDAILADDIPSRISLYINVLMAGMLVSMRFLMPRIDGGADPARPGFWFVMPMALIAGFCLAYPVNWWLVVNGMKHGMITVRRHDNDTRPHDHATTASTTHGEAEDAQHSASSSPSTIAIAGMTALTLVVLATGIVLSSLLGR